MDLIVIYRSKIEVLYIRLKNDSHAAISSNPLSHNFSIYIYDSNISFIIPV